MSSFYRSNLYGGHEEDEDVPFDEMDMSGFLNGDTPRGDFDQPMSEPVKPKVTARPRARSSSNASGTVGYVVPNPILPNEPDEPKLYHYASPFYADPDGIAPKAAAITKSIGVTGMVLSGTYAAAKRSDGGSPMAKAVLAGSTALYVHPTLGLNHGMLKVIPGKDNWIAKYPRYGGIGIVHALGAYGFYKIIRRQFYV
jgi:hypothetical protein|tara:strand:+ start:5790 stop:6383 length:594 start_codon:yes stop_codon:yes gene_type:complete